MSVTRLANTSLSLVAQALINAIDASGLGKIKFYTGPMPANPQTAITTQVLLGTLRTASPCGVVSGSSIVFNPIAQDDMADDTGAAVWARITSGVDGTVMDLDVSDLGGSGAIRLNTTAVVAGGPIRINTFTVFIGS